MRNFLQLHTDLSVINRCHVPAYGFCPLFNSKFYHDIFKQLHTFPEGKMAQDDQPIRRLKWGTASLIV